MQDRVPLYPGRVKILPVAGQANTFDMVRADEPTQAGAPLTKATFLKDATAALFGKTNAAVPDDILSLLSKSVLAQVESKYTKHTISFANLAVGDTVQLSVDGSLKEFLVVHKGLPSSLYDNSCNGLWLVMKDVYENRVWSSANSNDYANSTIHAYLNSTFLNFLGEKLKNDIKQIKIPYVNGTGSSGSVNSGANGLSTKIFLLGGYEVGWTTSDNQYFPVDGAKLSYFESGTGASANNKRIANLNGSASAWWLRSAWKENTESTCYVTTSGFFQPWSSNSTQGIRPAFILPADYQYIYYTDDSGNIYTEQKYDTNLTDVLGNKLTVGGLIESGSYVGTGAAGSDNKNSLIFNFVPYMVVIVRNSASTFYPGTVFIKGQTLSDGIGNNESSNGSYALSVSWYGKSVSWYHTSSAIRQLNAEGESFYYFAIGK